MGGGGEDEGVLNKSFDTERFRPDLQPLTHSYYF